MAIYEVTLRQSYFDQQMLNVWSYVSNVGVGITPSALELVEKMGFVPTGDPLAFPADTIAAALAAIQSDNVQYLSIEAREVYSLTDFYEGAYSPPLTGLQTGGDSMTPFAAYGLYSNRVRTDIRRAFKRFGGVLESDVAAGGTLVAGAVTDLTTLADAMSETLVGTAAQYFPCVISRLKQEIPDTDPVRYRYVLYPDPEDQAEHIAGGITFAPYLTLRSQISRQYGRGQ